MSSEVECQDSSLPIVSTNNSNVDDEFHSADEAEAEPAEMNVSDPSPTVPDRREAASDSDSSEGETDEESEGDTKDDEKEIETGKEQVFEQCQTQSEQVESPSTACTNSRDITQVEIVEVETSPVDNTTDVKEETESCSTSDLQNSADNEPEQKIESELTTAENVVEPEEAIQNPCIPEEGKIEEKPLEHQENSDAENVQSVEECPDVSHECTTSALDDIPNEDNVDVSEQSHVATDTKEITTHEIEKHEETYDEELMEEGDVERYEDEENLEEERESGDGEEDVPGEISSLDADEDRKNPAFIPKRGGFYQHDLRISEEDEAVDGEKPKRHLPSDKNWRHDMFDSTKQAPKRKDELVYKYGFDIRKDGQNDTDEEERFGQNRKPRGGGFKDGGQMSRGRGSGPRDGEKRGEKRYERYDDTNDRSKQGFENRAFTDEDFPTLDGSKSISKKERNQDREITKSDGFHQHNQLDSTKNRSRDGFGQQKNNNQSRGGFDRLRSGGGRGFGGRGGFGRQKSNEDDDRAFGGRGGFDRQRSGGDREHGARGGVGRQKSNEDDDRAFGGRGGFDRQRSGGGDREHTGRGGFDRQRSGSDREHGGRGGFDRQRSGDDRGFGDRGGFDRGRRNFDSRTHSGNDNRFREDDSRGGHRGRPGFSQQQRNEEGGRSDFASSNFRTGFASGGHQQQERWNRNERRSESPTGGGYPTREFRNSNRGGGGTTFRPARGSRSLQSGWSERSDERLQAGADNSVNDRTPPRFQQNQQISGGGFHGNESNRRSENHSQYDGRESDDYSKSTGQRRRQQDNRQNFSQSSRGAKRYSTQRQQGQQSSHVDSEPKDVSSHQSFVAGGHAPNATYRPQYYDVNYPSGTSPGYSSGGQSLPVDMPAQGAFVPVGQPPPPPPVYQQDPQYVVPTVYDEFPTVRNEVYMSAPAPMPPPPGYHTPTVVQYQSGDGGGTTGQPTLHQPTAPVFFDPDIQMTNRPLPKTRPKRGIPIVAPENGQKENTR